MNALLVVKGVLNVMKLDALAVLKVITGIQNIKCALDATVIALHATIGKLAQAAEKECTLKMMELVDSAQAIAEDAGILIIAMIAMKDYIQLLKDGVIGVIMDAHYVVLIIALNAMKGSFLKMENALNASLIATVAIVQTFAKFVMEDFIGMGNTVCLVEKIVINVNLHLFAMNAGKISILTILILAENAKKDVIDAKNLISAMNVIIIFSS